MTNLDVVSKIQSLISEGDEVDRCYAIQSLVTMKHTGANDLLVKCLRDEDIDVCIDAANALAELGDQHASEKLIDSLLNDPDGEVKTACIRALGRLQERKAIPHLLQIIEHRPEDIGFDANDWDFWWDMQLECIRAMGDMQVSESVPVIERLLATEDYLDIEGEIFNTLAKIGDEGVALLIDLLKTGNPRTRRRVAKALVQCHSKQAFKALARALQDNNPDVREATLTSLAGHQHSIHYLPIILHLFNDDHAAVRSTAIRVAQQLSKHTGVDSEADYSALLARLLPMLDDPDPLVKSMVLDSLVTLDWEPDPKTVAHIIQLLSKCEGDCFSALCRFIEHHQLQDATDDIVLLYKRNAIGVEEKSHAIATLGRLQRWDEDIAVLMGTAVYDERKNIRLAALEALADLDNYARSLVATDTPTQRLPFDMINEALLGSLAPPLSQRVIPVTVGDQQQTGQPPPLLDAVPATSQNSEYEFKDEGDGDFVARAMDEIRRSIKDGEKPVPLSTLDSIAVSCVEKQFEAQARQDANLERKQLLSSEEQDSLKKFLDITKANNETAKWLFNKEKVPVELDIQRLAARILGRIGSSLALPALLSVFDQEDSELKREAVLSIGRMAISSQLPDEIFDSIHEELIKALTDPNRDLRIAAIRTLADLGNEQDIDVLAPTLQDQEISVRIHAIHTLARLASGSEKLPSVLEQLLNQLGGNETGVNRAVADAVIPLFSNQSSAPDQLKIVAIERLIDAGLAGSDGQAKEMTRGLGMLDRDLSSLYLLRKLDQLETSIERRYVVEMLGELHRSQTLH